MPPINFKNLNQDWMPKKDEHQHQIDIILDADIRRYWKSAVITKLSKVWKLLQKNTY